ncbi:phosphoribosyltransferase, partial [Candidatus Gottesmanbacteria bacterium]|nr:phosphoribosyltransferase [Candidatus Gottesmanbacteria bacterium]
KSKKAEKIIVAVPVADREIVRKLGREVDSFIVLETVAGLGAVGNFYEDFGQVTDEEVVDILSRK